MSQQSLSRPTVNAPFVLSVLAISAAATLLLILLAAGGDLSRVAGYFASGHLHAPRFELLADASPAIKAHVAAVLIALGVGTVLMTGVKGTRLHKTLGWWWVVAMAAAAVASLFIQEITRGHGFSWLHIFSGWTLIALPVGIVAIRKRNVRLHARMMGGLFLGGLIVAGVTAFLPGRLMWQVFFG